MNQQERINAILLLLDEKEQLSVGEICQSFKVSKDTARRDIIKLEQMEMAERFHGGIRKPFLRPRLEDYKVRLVMNPEIKQILGKAAAQLVRNGDTILLDLSATVEFVAKNITANNVLAVTNSVDTAIALMETGNVRTYLTGGYLNPEVRSLLGMGVLEKIMSFYFDIIFIGASAVRVDGVYYMTEDDVVLKRVAIQKSGRVVLVADHTKFNESSRHRLDYAGIDLLVTDRQPPAELVQALKKNNVAIMVVDGDKFAYL